MRYWHAAAAASFALLLLLLLAQREPAVSKPYLVVVSPAAKLLSVEGNGSTYLFEVEVPPLSLLSRERIACVYEAAVVRVESSAGEALLEGNCIFLTVQNPGLAPLAVKLEVVSQQKSSSAEPPVAVIAAVTAVAAASYLTLTESGREKLFAALSVPAAYYVTRYEDVKRSAKRVKILEYLRANPGATMRRISREAGVSLGEVQWHLSILERLGLVQSVKIGKYSCYFLTGTPVETWLPSFVERELGAKIDARELEKLKPGIEPLLSRRSIPLGELLNLLKAGEPSR
ncbi:MAG: helix-turn-helix domain-containing protein [Thermofilum sp.]